jgi:hypothetical protein
MKSSVAALAIVGVLAVAGPVTAQRPGSSTILERILVRVNGEIFTQSELTQRQTDAVRARQEQPRAIPEAELYKLLSEMTPDILVETVDELLIVQHGRELGFKFSDDEFKKGLDTLKKDNNLDDQALMEALNGFGRWCRPVRSFLACALRRRSCASISPRIAGIS